MDESCYSGPFNGRCHIRSGTCFGSPAVGESAVVESMHRLARNPADLPALVQGWTRKGVRVDFVVTESRALTGETPPCQSHPQ